MAKTRVFVSDFHIGPEHQNDHFDSQNEFVKFLNELDKLHEQVELVFLGDMIDLISETNYPKNPLLGLLKNQKYRRFFQKLKWFASKHDVYFVIGNHDSMLVWNKEVQKTLKGLNIKFYKGNPLYYDYVFHYGNNKFKIYAEHGNQFNYEARFEDVTDPLDEPLSNKLTNYFFNRLERFAYKTKDVWLKDASIVKPLGNLIPWLYSKYFYYELSRKLRYVIAPLFAGFIATKVVFLLMLIYFVWLKGSITIPRILLPLFIIILIFLVLDFSFLVMYILFVLLRRDFRKNWQKYGVDLKLNVQEKIWMRTRKDLMKVMKSQNNRLFGNPKGVDFLIFGHHHEPHIHLVKVGSKLKGWCDVGSWRKNLVKIKPNFRLPSVFIPVHRLTYLKLYQDKSRIIAELRERYKKQDYNLTLMERIAVFRKWKKPEFKSKDKLLQRAVFLMSL